MASSPRKFFCSLVGDKAKDYKMCRTVWFLFDCSWAIGQLNPPAYFQNNTVAVLIPFKSLPTSDFSAWLICSNTKRRLQLERAGLFSTRRLKVHQGILNWLTKHNSERFKFFLSNSLPILLIDWQIFLQILRLPLCIWLLAQSDAREQWDVSSVNWPGPEEIPCCQVHKHISTWGKAPNRCGTLESPSLPSHYSCDKETQTASHTDHSRTKMKASLCLCPPVKVHVP